MPTIIQMFWGAFAGVLSSLVGRVCLALGIALVTYQGVDILLDNLISATTVNLGYASQVLGGVIGMMRLSESINVVVSATVAKYTMQGLTSGSITRMVFK